MSTILLIDDNPQNNSGYINDLKKHHSVEVAMRLVSAVRLLETRQFDIIVIDVMMPTRYLANHRDETTTGFAFFTKIKSKLSPNCIVVFWSRLEKGCYNEYWERNHLDPPENTFFVHKNDLDDHLTKKIDEINSNK